MPSTFIFVAYFQMHFRLDFIMTANTINPEQEKSDLGFCCLQHRLSKKGADKKVVTGRLRHRGQMD